MASKARTNVKRFDRLWAAAETALWFKEYSRCFRILGIIGTYGRPQIEGDLVRDAARYVRTLRAALAKEPLMIRLSQRTLDQLTTDDGDLLKAMIERQERVSCYRRRRREISAMLARGDLQRAKEALRYLSADAIEGAVRWAEKKLQELGETQ